MNEIPTAPMSSGMAQESGHYYDVLETPLGWMGMLASARGLKRTTLPEASPDLCITLLGPEMERVEHFPKYFAGLKSRLALYFDGRPVGFDDQPIVVDDAPDFHRSAWAACRAIPYGETRTYKWLAAQAGSPNAPRAAGQSMARNRLPIIIPCHRVVASDGTLGGFGKGASRLDLKQWLLDLETGKIVSSHSRNRANR